MKIFSGIRSSGQLHLGNYLGAIKNWIDLQHEAEQAVYAVVDYHGITTPYDPATYQEQVLNTVTTFLAAGIDPEKSILIRQSKVPQHTELAWLFNTITPIGWLDRLPTYKEKVSQVESSGSDRAKSYQNTLALLAYPVLMAADILLYKPDTVPVGEDQLVHIDVTNEIGKKFNHLFGETFGPVKAYMMDGARIMSLQDPKKKMSKTGDDGIALTDDPDNIRRKLKKALTDSDPSIDPNFDYDGNKEQKPGTYNLLNIFALIEGKSIVEVRDLYQGKTYSKLKEDLAEVVVNFLKPFQEKYKDLKSNSDHVLDVLSKSEERARIIASTNLADIKAKMGV